MDSSHPAQGEDGAQGSLPRLKVQYVTIAPIAPARSGYSVRCQTVADALMALADLRVLVLQGEADETGADQTATLYPADIVAAPPQPKAAKALIHARAAVGGRNRWVEKFAHGALLRKTREALRSFDADVIVLGHSALVSLVPALDLPWERVIVEHHNVETVNYARMAAVRNGPRKVLPLIDARAFRHIEKLSGRAADRWAVSAPDSAALEAMHRKRVRVVPNVAPERCFALDARGVEPDAPAVLGFLGNYHYPPNVDAAFGVCDVSALLRREGIAHEAIIMGRDPGAALRQRAEAVGATITGFVDDPEPYLSRFTMQLAPLTSGSGTKLKIVESLAMGIPVVTTPLGAEGLPIREEGLGLVAEDQRGLAKACATLLADRARVAVMGRRAREWARANVSMDALNHAIEASLASVAARLPQRSASLERARNT